MTRSNPGFEPIVSSSANIDSGDIFNANDLDFGWQFGFQGRATTYFSGGFGLDFGGFWLSPFTADFDSGGFASQSVWVETTPETDFGLNTRVTADNTTSIWGLDGNVLYQVSPMFTFYAGAAFINLHDALNLDMEISGGPANEVATWDVSNRMIGPQIGGRVTFGDMEPGAFQMTADARAGLLFNSISNSFNLDRSGNADPNDVTASDTAKSNVLMLGGAVAGGYQVSETISFNLGYQILLLRNVGLAPDQVRATDDFNVVDGTTIDMDTNTNDFLTHGFTFGLSLGF